jgi:hypothetical protein
MQAAQNISFTGTSVREGTLDSGSTDMSGLERLKCGVMGRIRTIEKRREERTHTQQRFVDNIQTNKHISETTVQLQASWTEEPRKPSAE